MFLCLQHILVFIYFFLLLVFVFTSVFNLYSTTVVNLYGTTHGKNNQLYNYFYFWFLFLCLQHITVFIYFCFWVSCLLASVFNLYSIDFFFPYITIIVNLYGITHEKNNQLYNFFLLLIFVFTAYTSIVFIIKFVLYGYFSIYT